MMLESRLASVTDKSRIRPQHKSDPNQDADVSAGSLEFSYVLYFVRPVFASTIMVMPFDQQQYYFHFMKEPFMFNIKSVHEIQRRLRNAESQR